ncbi:Squalene synthase, partial [hydrothermal vent metagenome]
MKKEREFLAQLKSVSRSFYLTLRILPAGARQPIAIAYLLARAADTIADSAEVSAEERLAGLAALRRGLENSESDIDLAMQPLVSSIDNLAERNLLETLSAVFTEFHSLVSQDSASIIKVIRVLVSGMELDIKRFHQSNVTQPIALANSVELDDYTYRVAGCVGAFWTEIISRHDPALAHWNVTVMSEKGVRYGKALQLTNILRDLPEDLHEGRCYLPLDELSAVRLTPEQLLNAEQSDRLKPVFQHWLKQALVHYDEG